MNWFLVDKSGTPQPAAGSYREWKGIVREEGRNQCVYCAIHESQFGGERNFHVEHYRPKRRFDDLRHVIANLFYSCAICNSFKGSDWPADPPVDLSVACYPDPSQVDYSTFLFVSTDKRVAAECKAGRYVIERLYLNRPQLVFHRKIDAVFAQLPSLVEKVIDGAMGGRAEAIAALPLVKEAVDLLAQLRQIAPYEPEDVRRR